MFDVICSVFYFRVDAVHCCNAHAVLFRLQRPLKTAPGFKVFSDDRIKLLLLHLQSMTESLLPVMLMELLLNISVLLMPKWPLVSFRSMRIQAAAAVVAVATMTDLVSTRNLV